MRKKPKKPEAWSWYPGGMTFLLQCLTAAYLAFLGGAAFYFSTPEHRRMLNFMQAIPYWDKYFHFCATGMLSFFLNLVLSFRVWRIGGLPFLWGSWIVIVMSVAEEYSQSFIPGRVFDAWDIFAAASGSIFFGRLAMFIYRKEFRQPILRKLRWMVRQSIQDVPWFTSPKGGAAKNEKP